MKPIQLFILLACTLALGTASEVHAQSTLRTLHTFTGASAQNADYPYARLALSGTTLYGTAFPDNGNTAGTVFKVNTDGTGYKVLHTFLGGSDGGSPQGGVVVSSTTSGTTLYGTTVAGGSKGFGTVFKVKSDGSGFTVLHSFTGGSDGGAPLAGLVLSNGILYGTTSAGASSTFGTVFKIGITGSGFTVLHTFTGGGDGGGSQADLFLSGSTLYGTTALGGSHEVGTVFKVSTTGSGFATLHTFAGGSEGASPAAAVVLVGGALYGTTAEGGSANDGTVFSVSTSGTGFKTLWSFTDSDGAFPLAGLAVSGSTLFGTTEQGGTGETGTVFSINTSGTGFTVLHRFANSDGTEPAAALVLSGSTLYGTAPFGGGTNVLGTAFKIGTNGSGFATVHRFAVQNFVDGAGPHTAMVLSGSMMYGTTQTGGSHNLGTVYQVSIDGTLEKTLHNFTGGTDGASPESRLVLSGKTLYGTANGGSAGGSGSVFKINTDGTGFAVLHTFTGSDGADPAVGVVLSGSTLYGVTTIGGSHNQGTLFKVGIDGSGFAVLHTFTGGNDGNDPASELTLSGTTLYGMTENGGAGLPLGGGTIFKINTDGSGFTTLYAFTGGSDGLFPLGPLILSGTILYGVASDGGDFDNGTVFAFDTSSKVFLVLHAFTDLSDGGFPASGLVLSNGTLYGTCTTGGASDVGTVFSVNISTKTLTTLWTFSNGDGATANGLLLHNGVLYGTTFMGAAGNGTVFSLPVP
jgi:uncharacterized repeat protein (TIGR03803 family)